MYAPAGVKTSTEFPIPDTMKAWVLGGPGELTLKDKPVPVPKRARSARPIWKSSIRARRP
jgi:L-iditol 2-dehydrogenase